MIILAAANDPKPTFVQKGYNEVVNFMRGAEMKHLIFIDQYILHKYTELKQLNCMKRLDRVMKGTIRYLTTLPPDEIM